MGRFEGKGVVVSGAAQGIGLGMAERFLAEGAGVVAFDRNGPKLAEEVAARLGRALRAFPGDVAVHEDCRGAVARCVERFGAIDVMCAHTGIADPLPLLEETEEHWRRHMAVNVDGVMFCTVEAARAMVAAGAARGDRVHELRSTPGSWRRRWPPTTSPRPRCGRSSARRRSISPATASASTASRRAWPTRRWPRWSCRTSSSRRSTSRRSRSIASR